MKRLIAGLLIAGLSTLTLAAPMDPSAPPEPSHGVYALAEKGKLSYSEASLKAAKMPMSKAKKRALIIAASVVGAYIVVRVVRHNVDGDDGDTHVTNVIVEGGDCKGNCRP